MLRTASLYIVTYLLGRTRQWRRLFVDTAARTCDGRRKECWGWRQTPCSSSSNRHSTVSRTPSLTSSVNRQSEVYTYNKITSSIIGPIVWGLSGPLCHALSLWTSILRCRSPGVATVARRLRYSYSWLRLILVVVSTVATPGEWQSKIRTGGVRQLAAANGPNIFQMLLVLNNFSVFFLNNGHVCNIVSTTKHQKYYKVK